MHEKEAPFTDVEDTYETARVYFGIMVFLGGLFICFQLLHSKVITLSWFSVVTPQVILGLGFESTHQNPVIMICLAIALFSFFVICSFLIKKHLAFMKVALLCVLLDTFVLVLGCIFILMSASSVITDRFYLIIVYSINLICHINMVRHLIKGVEAASELVVRNQQVGMHYNI